MIRGIMPHQQFGWNERQAEDVVTELLDRETFPESIKRDAIKRIERGEPIRALKLVMEARVSDAETDR